MENGRKIYEMARDMPPSVVQRLLKEAKTEEERFFWAYVFKMNLQQAQKVAIEQEIY